MHNIFLFTANKIKIILMLTFVLIPTGVMAETVQVKLLAKPALSEEGISFKSDKGTFNMYAGNASDQVRQAFSKAKKGQCLKLEMKGSLTVNTEASEIISILPVSCSSLSSNNNVASENSGTTSGTFVKVVLTNEGGMSILIKNEKGKSEKFETDYSDSEYKKYLKMKGKQLTIQWMLNGVDPYKYKAITKIDIVDR